MHARPILLALFVGAVLISLSHSAQGPADDGPLAISSVRVIGMQGDGRYHVRLRGSFANHQDVLPIVFCEGKRWPSAVHAASPVILDISIPPHRNAPSCIFFAHRVSDGKSSVASKSLPNTGIDEIRGSIDRGTFVNGTRHGFEFYGVFPNWATLTLSVACTEGGEVFAPGPYAPAAPYDPQISYDGRSVGQINVSIGEFGSVGMRCAFTPTNPNGVATGPLWGPITLRPYDVYAGLAGFGAAHMNASALVGADAPDSLESGQRWLSRSGFEVTKISMTPRIRLRGPGSQNNLDNPYHINLDVLENECPTLPLSMQNADRNASPPFLPCAARSSPYQRLFNAADMKVIVITATDSASSGDYGNPWPAWKNRLEPSWYAQPGNTERVIQEYRALALALYETQHDTGKLFVIANWETDSELHGCYGSNYCAPTSCPYSTYVEGFRLWFSARKKGIQLAKAVAQSRGLGGVTVADGIEFNRPLRDSVPPVIANCIGQPPVFPEAPNTAIKDIIPFVSPEYVSYSAWAALAEDRGGTLDQDIIDIRYHLGPMGPKLFIGELGQWYVRDSASSWDSSRGRNVGFALTQQARAAQRAQLPATILWTGYDNDQYMFYENHGAERSIVGRLRVALNQPEQTESARIGGIHITRVGPNDLFEMYIDPYFGVGQFPTSIAGTTVRCSYGCSDANCSGGHQFEAYARIVPGSLVRGTNQSNLMIQHQEYWQDGVVFPRWCIVKIPGLQTHGPKAVTPTPTRQP